MLEQLLKKLIKEVKEERINQKLFEHVQNNKKVIR
jgi:hypothetical protein